MKLPRHSMFTKGFSLIEAIVAMALIGFFMVAVTETGIGGTQAMTRWIEEENAYRTADTLLQEQRIVLEQHYNATSSDPRVTISDGGALFKTVTARVGSTTLSEDVYDWKHAMGGDTCDIGSSASLWKLVGEITLPSGSILGGLDMLNKLIYVAVDSSVASDPDLYILDGHDLAHPSIISSLHTGTGSVTAHAIPGFVFLAEQSTRHPFRVVDVSDSSHPTLVYEYTSSTSTSVTGYGAGHSLYFRDNRLYLGTLKSLAPELLIFDVTNPTAPSLIATYETNTQINDIIARDPLVYIATPSEKQMRILDTTNPLSVREIASVSPSGYTVQDGEALYLLGQTLFMGRTVGGFDNVNNHELFAYNISNQAAPTLTWSQNIASSLNNILINRGRALLGVGNSKNAFSVFDISSSTPSLLQTIPFSHEVVSMDCEGGVVVVGEKSPARISLYTQ